MLSAEYVISSARNHGWFHEKPDQNDWSKWLRQTSRIKALEEEIRVLRLQMEAAYKDRLSLTDERVVGISRELDMKLNEYMRLKRESED